MDRRSESADRFPVIPGDSREASRPLIPALPTPYRGEAAAGISGREPVIPAAAGSGPIQTAAALARRLRQYEAAAVLDHAALLAGKGQGRASAAWLALLLDMTEGDLAAAVADALAAVTGRYRPLFDQGPGEVLAGKPLTRPHRRA